MRLLRLLPVTVVMGLLFFLSSLPGRTIPLPQIVCFDKFAHASAYAVLAAAALFAVPDKLRQSRPQLIALLTVLFCLLYGCSDEFHQSFVPSRDASGFDLLADTFGASAMMLMLRAVEKRQQAVRCT